MIKDRDTTIGYHCPYCGLSILNDINIFSMYGNIIKLKCVCGSSELIVQTLRDNKYKITVPCILCPNSHSYTLSSGAFFQKDIFAFTCKFTAINICFIGKYGKVHEALKKNEEELMQTFAELEEEYGGGDADNYGGNIFLNDDDSDYYFDKFGGYGGENGGDYDDEEEDSGYFNAFDALNDFDGYGDTYGPGEKEPEFVLYRNENYIPDPADDDVTDGTINKQKPPGGQPPSNDDRGPAVISSYQILSQVLDNILRLQTDKNIVCKCGNFDGKINIMETAVRIGCKNCGSKRDIRSASIADAEYMDGLEALYLDYDD